MSQPIMSIRGEVQHQGYLHRLEEIRDHLGKVRKDRTAYVRSEDVLQQYCLLCQQIHGVAHMDKANDELGGLSSSWYFYSHWVQWEVNTSLSLPSYYRLFSSGITIFFDCWQKQWAASNVRPVSHYPEYRSCMLTILDSLHWLSSRFNRCPLDSSRPLTTD